MKITDIIRRAGRNLRRAKIRTILTSVAIAVGGFAIMASFMVGEGARQYIDRVIGANMDPQTLAISKDERLFKMNGSAGLESLREYNPDSLNRFGGNFKGLTQKDIDKINSRDDIELVQPDYEVKPKYIQFSVKTDKKYIAQVSTHDRTISKKMSAGRQLKISEKLGRDEAIVPDSFAKTLGVKDHSQLVGSTVTLTVVQPPKKVDSKVIQETFIKQGEKAVKKLVEGKTIERKFKIVSVSDSKQDSLNGRPGGIEIGSETSKELSDFSTLGTDSYQKYIFAYALVKDGTKPSDVKDALTNEGYNVKTAKDLQEMLFTIVNVLQSIVLGFGTLALLVSIFGIINTQYISVLERTQQIGLMKALGASRRDIGRLFRYEAAWVGFLGGTIGVLAAWGIGTLANPWISQQLNFGEYSLLIFQADKAILIVIALMLVAIIAGFLPSRKAAKLDPIEALRTE